MICHRGRRGIRRERVAAEDDLTMVVIRRTE